MNQDKGLKICVFEQSWLTLQPILMTTRQVMKRVFLIGYMGAGKSTMGKWLAQVMNMEFIDLDNFIEARQHKTIKEIFAEIGEEGFRMLERRSLEEVSQFENVIISLGGGTPCFFDNMEIVNQAGTSVYLKPTEEVLLKRLSKGKHKRPLLAQKTDEEILQFMREQLAWREPYYLKAQITFEASHLENKAEIVHNAEKLAAQLQEI